MVILVAVAEITSALTPPTYTALFEAIVLKPVPFIVTIVPTMPVRGDIEVIV
jgi:hypothetical protein